MLRVADFSDLRDIFNAENNSDETQFTLKTILQVPDPTVSNQIDDREEENERFESIINFPNFLLQVNEAMEMTETDHDSGLDDKRFLELLKDRWASKEKAFEFIGIFLIVISLKGNISVNTRSKGNGPYKSSSCMRIKKEENHPISLL